MVRLRARRPLALRQASTDPSGSNLGVQTVSHHRLTWVNIDAPTEREVEFLREHYNFHPLDLDDVLSQLQTPKIDEYDDYLFLVIQLPVFNHDSRVTMAAEIDIFVGENYLITAHNGVLKPLNALFKDCLDEERSRQAYMGRSSGYLLYQLLSRLITYCFPIVNKISANVSRVEDAIFDDSILDNVREISLLRRDIISCRRIIRPQVDILNSLENKQLVFLKEDLDVYFGDLADSMRKISDILEDLKEVVEGLNDTNNTLSSHRLNDILRVLTVISTIMLPLSVVTGIYGMNISVLPFAETEYSFLVVVGFLLLLAGSMLGVFRWRRWI